MSTKVYPFRYNKQFAKYIGQFMRALSGFQVQDGVERGGEILTSRVPVVYGNMSRIVASILNKRSKLTNQKIPLIAVNLLSIEPDLLNKRSHIHKDEIGSKKVDLPVGKKVVERIFGPSFILGMEASIYASSNSELFQILEQILLVFNPRVTINIDNDAFNSDYITDIALTSISPDIQYPMGTESQEVMLTLSFSVPVRLTYPIGFNDNLVTDIMTNIKDDTGEGEIDLIDDVVN